MKGCNHICDRRINALRRRDDLGFVEYAFQGPVLVLNNVENGAEVLLSSTFKRALVNSERRGIIDALGKAEA
jgi:hypothetical protein